MVFKWRFLLVYRPKSEKRKTYIFILKIGIRIPTGHILVTRVSLSLESIRVCMEVFLFLLCYKGLYGVFYCFYSVIRVCMEVFTIFTLL